MLPRGLGRLFYEKKKFPFPIKFHKPELSGETLKNQVEEALKCTYLMLGNGPNFSMKIGRVNSSVEDTLKNIRIALMKAVTYIIMNDGIKHSRVQKITLHTPLLDKKGLDLPIFNQLTKEEVNAYS